MKKKIIAAALAVMLVLSLVPVSALADETEDSTVIETESITELLSYLADPNYTSGRFHFASTNTLLITSDVIVLPKQELYIDGNLKVSGCTLSVPGTLIMGDGYTATVADGASLIATGLFVCGSLNIYGTCAIGKSNGTGFTESPLDANSISIFEGGFFLISSTYADCSHFENSGTLRVTEGGAVTVTNRVKSSEELMIALNEAKSHQNRENVTCSIATTVPEDQLTQAFVISESYNMPTNCTIDVSDYTELCIPEGVVFTCNSTIGLTGIMSVYGAAKLNGRVVNYGSGVIKSVNGSVQLAGSLTEPELDPDNYPTEEFYSFSGVPTSGFTCESDGNGNRIITSLTSMRNFTPSFTYRSGMFNDVNEDDWYGANREGCIRAAYEYGLMNGMDNGGFSPADTLTVAQIITIACRLHNILHGSDGNFTAEDPWYQVYIDYALTTGFIKEGDFDSYFRAVTRAETAYILCSCLGSDVESVLYPARSVTSLPDVADTDKYASDIYRLTAAGVINGKDEYGTYYPNDILQRCEAAAMITRILEIAPRNTAPFKTK